MGKSLKASQGGRKNWEPQNNKVLCYCSQIREACKQVAELIQTQEVASQVLHENKTKSVSMPQFFVIYSYV